MAYVSRESLHLPSRLLRPPGRGWPYDVPDPVGWTGSTAGA